MVVPVIVISSGLGIPEKLISENPKQTTSLFPIVSKLSQARWVLFVQAVPYPAEITILQGIADAQKSSYCFVITKKNLSNRTVGGAA